MEVLEYYADYAIHGIEFEFANQSQLLAMSYHVNF